MVPTPPQEETEQTHTTGGEGLTEDTQQTAAESPDTDPSNLDDRKRDIRILLVEDSRMNREVALHILKRKLGHAADTATDGNEALQALKREKYDLVLMDCQMPGMDGYEATRTIRDPGSDVLDHDIRIIAITANAMKGDREKCLEAGMDDYITKPVRPEDLVAAVERNLPGHDATQAKTISSTDRCPKAVHSEWEDDPELTGILNDFVESLPARLAEMREALADNCYDEVRRIAHQLKGAGGGYGYPGLTEAARGLENAAQAQCRETILLALVQLSTLCRAVEAGHKSGIVAREA